MSDPDISYSFPPFCRVWYPTIQFTFKYHNPKTGKTVWKSINVNNCAPASNNRRSIKSDEFSITHKSSPGSEYPESYSISANIDKEVQVFLDIKRPATVPGFKVGSDEKGGYSYFGPDSKNPEGYVIHRFWPRFECEGHLVLNGGMQPVKGPGMFVHAIQGMRPNLVASRWNFANFQSSEQGGVSAIQMDFTTLDTHGPKGAGSGPVVVSVGSLVVGNKLVAVTSASKAPGQESASSAVVSKATHLKTEVDPDTGYLKPAEILYEWAAPSIASPGETYTAKLPMPVGSVASPKGLIDKVDVLAEIPYVLKVAVNYVAGTKPYIYQVSYLLFLTLRYIEKETELLYSGSTLLS